MTIRNAIPGMITGGLGLVAGLLGLIFDIALFGAVAGVLALASGYACLRLAQRIEARGLGPTSVVTTMKPFEVRNTSPGGGPREGASHEGDSASSTTPDGQAARDKATELHPSTEAAMERTGPRLEQPDIAEVKAGPNTKPASPHDNTMIDPATGLFSESFFSVSLQSRIAAARRHLRPVAIVLLNVVEGLPEHTNPVDAVSIAESIKETLREADTACRLESGEFALLLEDTPENGAIWTVERIRRHLGERQEGLTTWAGIACYPAHAFSPEEILGAAERALVLAREWRQDRIEVAATVEE